MNKFSLIAFLFIAGCDSQNTSNSSENKKDTLEAKINADKTSRVSCYVMATNKDSATLQLSISGNTVTGELTYDLFEKDSNTGDIKGVLQDSLVIADYTFQSEGTVSMRQVVFKIKDEGLYEGYGDITEDNSKAAFKDISQLQYHTTPFVKAPCK